jgi:peptidoglycan/LPS O-acetylase OafA/YrhL
MHHTTLADLPRLVRVAEEVRLRGQAAISVALAVVAYWLLAWLLDESVDAAWTGIHLAVMAVLAGSLAAIVSVRRLREGLAASRRPPRPSVHETRADGRDRRTKLAGLVVLGVVLLLAFDRSTDGEGRMAGLIVGLLLAVGVVDWIEARRWQAAERARGSLLYVLVRANALVSPFGVTDVYEVVRTDDDHERRDLESRYVI